MPSQRTRGVVVGLGILALGQLAADTAYGDGYSFVKVADTDTAIPGGPGKFTSFTFFPAVSGHYVGFEGPTLQPGDGIYRWDGASITTIATTADAIPNGTGTFLRFNGFSQDGPNTIFTGFNSKAIGNQTQAGVYSGTGGAITIMADMQTNVIRSNANLLNQINVPFIPSADAGKMAISALTRDGWQAVMSDVRGFLHPFADLYSGVPGAPGQNFLSLGTEVLRHDNIAFVAGQYLTPGTSRPIGRGIFEGNAHSLVTNVIATLDTPIPGGGGAKFSEFPSFIGFDGTNVSFMSDVGIYTNFGGSLRAAVTTSDLIPGTTTQFGGFSPITAMSNGWIVFAGGPGATFPGNADDSLYVWDNGVIHPILGIGQSLDGKIISDIQFGPESFKGSDLAIRVDFSNGSQGIYETSVPEPASSLGIILLAAGCFLTRNGHRSY